MVTINFNSFIWRLENYIWILLWIRSYQPIYQLTLLFADFNWVFHSLVQIIVTGKWFQIMAYFLCRGFDPLTWLCGGPLCLEGVEEGDSEVVPVDEEVGVLSNEERGVHGGGREGTGGGHSFWKGEAISTTRLKRVTIFIYTCKNYIKRVLNTRIKY